MILVLAEVPSKVLATIFPCSRPILSLSVNTTTFMSRNHLVNSGENLPPPPELVVATSPKSDNLSGQVMARAGELPPVWETLDVKLNLLKEMVGSGEGDAELSLIHI